MVTNNRRAWKNHIEHIARDLKVWLNKKEVDYIFNQCTNDTRPSDIKSLIIRLVLEKKGEENNET